MNLYSLGTTKASTDCDVLVSCSDRFDTELDGTVRSKPPDFSLQVYSSRSRPRQLQLPWSTSEEKPEIRELRSPGCPTETA